MGDRVTLTPDDFDGVCQEIAELLKSKNAGYGNSVGEPLEVFARGLSVEQRLGVRIDDKLSRWTRGKNPTDDTIIDLIGYLVLLLLIRRKRRASKWEPPPPDVDGTGWMFERKVDVPDFIGKPAPEDDLPGE